jgi:hypothetical protein
MCRLLLKSVVKQGKVQLKQRLVPQQVRHVGTSIKKLHPV